MLRPSVILYRIFCWKCTVHIGFGIGYAYLEQDRQMNLYFVCDRVLDRTSNTEYVGLGKMYVVATYQLSLALRRHGETKGGQERQSI